MVVVVQPCVFQAPGLRSCQHAKRDAAFQPKSAHALHHGADRIEIAVLGRAPGGTHAEARGAGVAGGARFGQHSRQLHQFCGGHAGLVGGGLRAVGAVFRAAAGLDREQCAHLNLVRVVMGAMHGGGAEGEVGERGVQQGADGRGRPGWGGNGVHGCRSIAIRPCRPHRPRFIALFPMGAAAQNTTTCRTACPSASRSKPSLISLSVSRSVSSLSTGRRPARYMATKRGRSRRGTAEPM